MCNSALAKVIDDNLDDIIQVPDSGAKTRTDFVSDRDFYLYSLRHSCAHLMAAAIKAIYPDAKFGIGPAIENGFYYDIYLDEPISEHDLKPIEKKMKKITSQNLKLAYEDMSSADATAKFASENQDFKTELISDIGAEEVTVFSLGDFSDLCRGPHVAKTSLMKNFKLTSVSAAYWKGDQANTSMQRIYGTVWETREELDAYLKMLESAKERDHRKLGEKIGLFKAMPFAPGSPVMLPNGMVVFREMGNFIRDLFLKNGYQEVRAPIMCHQSLWEKSGHWEKYKEDMFLIEGEKGDQYGLKAMNCPVHMSIFGMRPRSYRELPYRLHDQGALHRNEASGALSGMTRLKMFCQDDSHVFLPLEGVGEEIARILKLTDFVYSTFNMKYKINLSTKPDNALGTDEEWEIAEAALRKALEASGREYLVKEGDGAFYGPKIDFDVEDVLGRSWQVATAQLDFQQPQRFDLKYTDENGEEQMPVVIHNAIFGAIERFLAILIENYNGRFPLWMAPVQARILTISDDFMPWAQEIHEKLLLAGIRAEIDVSGDRLGKKIALAESEKVSSLMVIGQQEFDNKQATLRIFGEEEQLVLGLEDVVAELIKRCKRPDLPKL